MAEFADRYPVANKEIRDVLVHYVVERSAALDNRLLVNLSLVRLLPPPGPGKMGLVSLPVWLWVDANANTCGLISHTATDGPLSVTLTATVERIVWDMGDGGTVTCTTPGVPYRPAYNDRPSPA